MWVRKHAPEPRQLSQETASLGEQPDDRQRVMDLRGQRARDEGPVAGGRSDDLAGSAARELFWFHQNAIRSSLIAFCAKNYNKVNSCRSEVSWQRRSPDRRRLRHGGR